MRATTVILIGFGLLIVAHWANGQSAVTAKLVVETVFAILVVAFLDQGRTEPIAQGLAWLFLVAVLLSNNSPLTALAKVTGTGTAPAKAA